MNRLNKYADIISGAVFFIIACILFISSFSIRQRASSTAIGPRFMPQLIAVIFAALSLLIMISGIKKANASREKQGDFPGQLKALVPVGLTIILMILYVVVIPLSGFVLSTVLYLFLQFILLDVQWKSKVYHYAIIAVLTSCVIYIIFRYLFSLTLPPGILF